jgi:nucleotide-binding universal stress UspA family protein
MPEGLGPIGLKKFLASHGALDKPIELQELEKFCATPFAKVLIPTDFSQPSEAIISFIKGMKNIGEILLLHVVSEGETQEAIDKSAKAAFDRLYGIIQDLAKVGLKATPLVGVGDTVEQICSTAYVENVSLIVMSSVGKDDLERGRIGKIGFSAYDVANSADRPVLILRMKPVFEIPA